MTKITLLQKQDDKNYTSVKTELTGAVHPLFIGNQMRRDCMFCLLEYSGMTEDYLLPFLTDMSQSKDID